jgi:BNR repeat-containing family member
MRDTSWPGRIAGISLLFLLCLVAAAPASAGQADFGAGGWSWFQDPRAVTHKGAHHRTYVGWITPAGDVTVGSYDHDTKAVTSAVLHPVLETDDHASPALLVRPDGHVVAFYSRHSLVPMYYRVSTRPEDVTSWEPRQEMAVTNTTGPYGVTYANPIRLAAEQRTYLFWRGADANPLFSTVEDGEGDAAADWSPAGKLIDIFDERPYVKYASSGGDTIHFAFTEAHPHTGDEPSTNIFYARYRDGDIEQADGTDIGDLGTPITPGQADPVYNHPDRPAWVHDMAIGTDGLPVIVFASYPDSLAATGHLYHYARYNGSSWDVRDMTLGGGTISTPPRSPLYSGGMSLDHQDPSNVYVSRQVGPDDWAIEIWKTVDGGTTWTSRNLTPNPTVKNIRPLSPRGNEPNGEMVIWMSGEYPNYNTLETTVTSFIEDPPPVFPTQTAPESEQGATTPASTPGPSRADARIARLALASKVLRIGPRGAGRLAVRCRARAGDRCLVRGSIRSATRLGSITGRVAAGRRGTVRVQLTRAARTRLRRARRLRARVTGTSTSRSGRRAALAGTLRLALRRP